MHAALTLSQYGYETVMVNCNPETVSTDYDTSDRLYFEPLTLEDVLEVYHAEAAAGPVAGVIVQLGGQTPLKLAQALKDAGVPVVGTSPEAIHLAEERGAFGQILSDNHLTAPAYGMATSAEDALEIAHGIGYPVLVRPSYVLGGRGMEIVYDDTSLVGYIERATHITPNSPVLVDRFLDDAIEIDVDALYDGTDLYLGGVMEHIEEAGIHSGDSACALPPITLGTETIDRIRSATEAIARGVGVRGLINIQFALLGDVLYVLEANPRASRTVPFVSKATDTPLAKAAARIMLGASIADLRADGTLRTGVDGTANLEAAPLAVKEAVMPFNRFRTADGAWVDTLLGPEMKSTGEVMGLDVTFGVAFAKSQTASYGDVPTQGSVFVSVANRDKRHAIFPVKRLADLGFRVYATEGTAQVLRRNDVEVTVLRKETQGPGADGTKTVVQAIMDGEISLIFNTPLGVSEGGDPRRDGWQIRSAAILCDVPCVTTVAGLSAAVQGIEALRRGGLTVRPLQAWSADMRRELAAAPPRPRKDERVNPRVSLVDAGYRAIVRPAMFGAYHGDPEAIHETMIANLARFSRSPLALSATRLLAGSRGAPVTVAGIRFPGRVGVAAGLDKDGRAALAWQSMGFGFAELGTVTAQAQPGNARPRVFRLKKSHALINRMGFNNAGAQRLHHELSLLGIYRDNAGAGIPIGISIGKTKVVPVEAAVDDYLASLALVAPHADYVAINVSSPNTPGLRSLQDGERCCSCCAPWSSGPPDGCRCSSRSLPT